MGIFDERRLDKKTPKELALLIQAFNLTPHDSEKRSELVKEIWEVAQNHLHDSDLQSVQDMLEDEAQFNPKSLL